MLSGRRSLVRARASEAGEVIELDRDHLLALVQTDSELSEIIMRAFILRRVELIAHGLGDVVLIGSNHCAGTLRVKEFLTRNGHPYSYIDLDRDDGVQELLDRFRVSAADVPVLICRGDVVLRNPTNQEIADCLGFNEAIDQSRCVTWSSSAPDPRDWRRRSTPRRKGWTCWWSRRTSPADRPGRSSKIENYLGFPDRHLRTGSGRARLHAGAEIRGAGNGRQRGANGWPATARPTRSRSTTACACPLAPSSSRPARRIGACRSRICRSSRAQASTTARRSWRRSCAAGRSRRRGRRQLGRPGGGVSGADAPSACTCSCGRRAGRDACRAT